jgi:hypothetical protein
LISPGAHSRTTWRILGSGVSPQGTIIPANGYLLVWADQRPWANGSDGSLHADLKLSADGEAIGLFAADGTLLDAVEFGPQQADVSQGRLPDALTQILSFARATPGQSNSTGAPILPVQLQISHQVLDPGLRLSWTSEPGKRYQLQFTRDLNGTWTPLGEPVTASATVSSIMRSKGAGATEFYRLVRLD